jgi:biopolymer transport protein TolR
MAMRPLDAGGDGDELEPVSEINVTPLVDVMLVLLIIFMVVTPMMTVSVNVALPKTSAAPAPQPKEPLVISIDAEGALYIKDEKLSDAREFGRRLADVHRDTPERIVLVRGDRSLTYGRIMEVMGQVSRAGFTKVSLIAEEAQSGRAR